MNRNKIAFLLAFAFAAVSVPSAVMAASTISLVPAFGAYTVGSTYTVSVYVDPQGVKAFSTKIEISYPANIIQVTGFTPAPGTIHLVQPGYDITDNTAGKAVKTVGFPGGITTRSLVGTVTFSAKAVGSASVITAQSSEILDANNLNMASAFGTASYVISSRAPAVIQDTSSSATATATSATTTNDTDLTAAVGSATSTPLTGKGWLVGALVILAVLATGYTVWGKKKA